MSFENAAIVDAGPDQIICEDQVASLAGIAQNQQSIQWSTTGDGTFSDQTSLTSDYTPGANDLLTGSVTLTLEAFGIPPCGSDSDELTVTFTARPNLNIGSDLIACQGETVTFNDVVVTQFDIITWTTSGSGTLLNANSSSPTYIPAANETGLIIFNLTVDPLLPCSGQVFGQKVVEYNPEALVDAGPDALLCQEDGSFTIVDAQAQNVGSILWSAPSGDGSFINENTLNPTYTPGPGDYALGSVILQITGQGLSGCQDTTDSMELTLVESPVVSAGPDDSICEGQTYTIPGASANVIDFFGQHRVKEH